MGCNQSTEIHKTKDIVTISGKNPLNTLDDYNEILLLTQIVIGICCCADPALVGKAK